jgi:hypothetical protein
MFTAIIVTSAALLASGMTFASNCLALIPWRHSRGQHWSEQARLLHPARVAARSNLLCSRYSHARALTGKM